MKFFKHDFLFLLCVIAITSSGCEEFLPPRDIPPVLFSVETRMMYDFFPAKTPQFYRNQIKCVFVIKNIYDETIQDTLNFGGYITLRWLAQVQSNEESILVQSKTVQLNKSFIKYIKGYNGSTGILTLNPQDSLIIEYDWNFVTDDSSNLLKHFPAYRRGGVNGCIITSKQNIRISASIQLMSFKGSIIIQPIDYFDCFFVEDGEPPCVNFIDAPCN